MPFTLSHAAAALPFRRFKPIWSALVIGTFAPDFQYFIWMSDENRSGHHFPGVVLLSLPLALLVVWLFERFVKGPVIELLPDTLQGRLQNQLQPLLFWSWRQFASIVSWIAVGIATHIFWDWFTHPRTWITANWALFSRRMPVPFHAPMVMSKILQHGSTVFGILVLAVWMAIWYRRTTPVPKARQHSMSPFRKVTIAFALALIALIGGYYLAALHLADREFPISHLTLQVTVFEAVTLVLWMLLLIYGLARTFVTRGRRMPATQLNGVSR
jgi:hypothetical protein